MLLLLPEHAGQVAVAVHAQLEVNVAFQQIPASPLGGPLAVKRDGAKWDNSSYCQTKGTNQPKYH